jgi:hypothetical protein
MDELADMRIDALAAERVATFDESKAITHEDMKKMFGMDD